jgi:hypothetical protein
LYYEKLVNNFKKEYPSFPPIKSSVEITGDFFIVKIVSMLKKRSESMKVGSIVKDNQPDMHNKLKKKKKRRRARRRKENLTFNDFENMMKHDSYGRGKGGAIRQVRRG